MKELIFYNTSVVTQDAHQHLPGMRSFKKFFSIYPRSSVFVDRSGTVSIPVRVKSLFPIPKMRAMKKTFEEVCNDRAKELLTRAATLNAPIYVAWSGGIDSTLVLVSLLKMATAKDRARITVLLTEESISEYPEFYADHIRGKLRCDSMTLFPYLLGTNALLIGGENNDQIFGSDVSAKLINLKGPGSIHEAYQRGVLFDVFDSTLQDRSATEFCLDLIERVAAKAPVALSTHYDYLWWLSFCVKWQFVATRMLPYTRARNAAGITHEYLCVRYDQFYNTDAFQLWSMNNLDKKIKDGWNTYKWPCKDIIYEFAKHEEYWKFKQKRGSLSLVLQQQISYNFVDADLSLYKELDVNEYYNPDNDFV